MQVMYDSVNPDRIPATAGAVAGYVGGEYPTFAELVRRWPHAHRLSIAVNADENAECLDVERGDATPADAPAWWRRQRARGVAKPVIYASLSVIPEIVAAMRAAGISRDAYRIWSAHYTGHPHICGAECGLHGITADATQYVELASRDLDVSLCTDAFFTPPAPYVPADEKRWEHEYDNVAHRRGPWPAIRRRALKRRMRTRIFQLLHAAEYEGGWGRANRQNRYRKLLARV